MRQQNMVTIRETHRGLLYEDGVLVEILASGRYAIPQPGRFLRRHVAKMELVLVDMRERERCIVVQEQLTADGVPVVASIFGRFRVVDPKAALHAVKDFEDRVHSDIHLAAVRALRTLDIETVLTPGDALSRTMTDGLRDDLARYGVGLTGLQTREIRIPEELKSALLRLAYARYGVAGSVEPAREPMGASIDAERSLCPG